MIACRLIPMQKRELVNLTITAKPHATTLAIGANDVSMILEANVGVGIFDKEGHQAANNADFVIGEFKFLRRLLLVHGVSVQHAQEHGADDDALLVELFTAVSGTSPYESWIYSGFNFILSLPIILFGILDRDLSAAFCLKHPQTYSTDVLLNMVSILQWIGDAMVYAVVCSFLPSTGYNEVIGATLLL